MNKIHHIACRMTEAEYKQFHKLVSKTYLSNSEFIRRLLLNYQLPIPTRAEVEWSNFAVMSLSQLNNNVNQIARVMNGLKGCDTVVIGSVAQRQLNQIQEIMRDWKIFDENFKKTL